MTKLKFESLFFKEAELDEMLETHCINEIKKCDKTINEINELESWDDEDKYYLEKAQYVKLFYQTQLKEWQKR
jgi:hypothetical protein